MLRKTANLLTRILDIICGVGMLALFVMVCISVVLRYAFNQSIYGLSEIQNYLFVYLTALGAAAGMRDNEHVGVDFFEKASPSVRKVLACFRSLCMVIVQVSLLPLSFKWIQKVGGYLTPLLQIPQRWAQMAVPIGMGLGALLCVLGIFVTLVRRNGKEELL